MRRDEKRRGEEDRREEKRREKERRGTEELRESRLQRRDSHIIPLYIMLKLKKAGMVTVILNLLHAW